MLCVRLVMTKSSLSSLLMIYNRRDIHSRIIQLSKRQKGKGKGANTVPTFLVKYRYTLELCFSAFK